MFTATVAELRSALPSPDDLPEDFAAPGRPELFDDADDADDYRDDAR